MADNLRAIIQMIQSPDGGGLPFDTGKITSLLTTALGGLVKHQQYIVDENNLLVPRIGISTLGCTVVQNLSAASTGDNVKWYTSDPGVAGVLAQLIPAGAVVLMFPQGTPYVTRSGSANINVNMWMCDL